MIVELLRVQCGCGNTLTGLFDNHHSAIVAGERAGWLMQSESIGGDQCPRCLGREEASPVQLLSGIDIGEPGGDWTGKAQYIDANDLRGLTAHQLETAEYMLHLPVMLDGTAWLNVLQNKRRAVEAHAKALRDIDALEEARTPVAQAISRAKKERDEARAEVERLTDWADMLRLALVELDEARADRDGCIARGVKLWEYAADVTGWYDSALALVDLHEQWEADAQKERDEARAEVERLKVELAAARKECLRVAREQWDTNDNGAIDDADELAAYAEASDLRALAERESE